MIFSSSIGLWYWSTIHPQSVNSLGAYIYVDHPQSPPSHLQDYSTCNSARWLNLFPWFDPNEWCMKNGLLSGGLNPGPLGHESSALPLDHGYSPLSVPTLTKCYLNFFRVLCSVWPFEICVKFRMKDGGWSALLVRRIVREFSGLIPEIIRNTVYVLLSTEVANIFSREPNFGKKKYKTWRGKI